MTLTTIFHKMKIDKKKKKRLRIIELVHGYTHVPWLNGAGVEISVII